MRREFLPVILADLWLNLRRKKGKVLAGLVWTFLLTVVGIVLYSPVVMGANLSNEKSALEFFQTASAEDMQGFFVMLLMGAVAGGIVILRYLPLRICRGVYACPTGERDRMHYLYMQLGVKMLIGFLVIVFFSSGLMGVFFFSENLLFDMVQVLLVLFVLLDVNLSVGIGTKSREADEEGYPKISKEEEMLKAYWTCVLVLEGMFFWLYPMELYETHFFITAGIWAVLILINVLFLKKYMSSFLREISSYEFVYCQKPKTEY